MARVATYENGAFYVDAEVIALDPKRRPKGWVRFFLHDTYKKRIHPIAFRNGHALLSEIKTSGPYTVGAEIESTGTRLELDLATIPCHYRSWKSRAYEIIDGLVT